MLFIWYNEWNFTYKKYNKNGKMSSWLDGLKIMVLDWYTLYHNIHTYISTQLNLSN